MYLGYIPTERVLNELKGILTKSAYCIADFTFTETMALCGIVDKLGIDFSKLCEESLKYTLTFEALGKKIRDMEWHWSEVKLYLDTRVISPLKMDLGNLERVKTRIQLTTTALASTGGNLENPLYLQLYFLYEHATTLMQSRDEGSAYARSIEQVSRTGQESIVLLMLESAFKIDLGQYPIDPLNLSHTLKIWLEILDTPL